MTVHNDAFARPGQRRKRLGAYVPLPGRVRAVLTPMMRPQTVADPTLMGPGAVSFLLHVVPFLLVWLWNPIKPYGTLKGMDEPQVEMVFTPPTRSPGQSGPHMPAQGGSVSAPPPPSPVPESAPKPVVPTPQIPSSALAPPVSDGELANVTPSPRPVSPATPRHARQQQTSPLRRRAVPSRQNDPLAHPQDWSFNSQPVPHPRRRGRRGGSGGAIDMSLGPLSLNGQINAPYRTRNMVRGVSSDYGSEIDRWIRAHMFYPEDAANAGEEGPSSVHVVIDRSGHVRSVRLTNQSGSYALDAATTGMFQGAMLPPVPPDMAGDHFDLDVTINYILIRH